MDILLFIPQYARWHYGRGIHELKQSIIDFLWFLTQFFSLGLLAYTLFAPWRRISENYSGGFHVGAVMTTFTVNTLMRAVGFCIRVLVLCIGFITIVISVLFSTVLFICWLLLPAILFFMFALSLKYFFQ